MSLCIGSALGLLGAVILLLMSVRPVDATDYQGNLLYCPDYNLVPPAGVTNIIGDLTVCASATTLSGLSGIVSVQGGLKIEFTQLVSCTGLESLRRVAGFISLDSNYQLADISALSGIRGSLSSSLLIRSNPRLTSIAALAGISGSIPLDLMVDSNNLKSLRGLDSITGAASLTIGHENDLLDLSPLLNISDLGRLTISSNSALRTLNGLSGLSRISNALYILDNAALEDINALAYVRGPLVELRVSGNRQLPTLDPLRSLGTIIGSIQVFGPGDVAPSGYSGTANAALESFCGLCDVDLPPNNFGFFLSLLHNYEGDGPFLAASAWVDAGRPCGAGPVYCGNVSVTPLPTPSGTLSATITPSVSALPTPSSTRSPSPSPTSTASISVSHSATRTHSPTRTKTPTGTAAATASPTATPSVTASVTQSPSPTNSISPSATSSVTSLASPTSSPSATSIVSPGSPTASVTATALFGSTLSMSSSPTASRTLTSSPSPSASQSPSLTVSQSQSLTTSRSLGSSPSASATRFSVSPTSTSSTTSTRSQSTSPSSTRSPSLSTSSTKSSSMTPSSSRSPSIGATSTSSPSSTKTSTRTGSAAPSGSRSASATPTPGSTADPGSPTPTLSVLGSSQVADPQTPSPSTMGSPGPTGGSSSTLMATATLTSSFTLSPSAPATSSPATASPLPSLRPGCQIGSDQCQQLCVREQQPSAIPLLSNQSIPSRPALYYTIKLKFPCQSRVVPNCCELGQAMYANASFFDDTHGWSLCSPYSASDRAPWFKDRKGRCSIFLFSVMTDSSDMEFHDLQAALLRNVPECASAPSECKIIAHQEKHRSYVFATGSTTLASVLLLLVMALLAFP